MVVAEIMELVLVELQLVIIADVDVNVCVDVDDDVILVVNMVMVVHQLNQNDLKIYYLIHDEEDLLDQL